MRKRKAHYPFIFSLVVLLALSACSEDEEFVFEGVVSIEVQDSSLIIFNRTNVTIDYLAVERETMNSFDWRPCDHPDECKDVAIDPERSIELPYMDITGWEPGTEVVVLLWYLVKDSSTVSGYRVVMLPNQTVDTPPQ